MCVVAYGVVCLLYIHKTLQHTTNILKLCNIQVAMDEAGVVREDLTGEETVEEREMTQSVGIFYMLYESKEAAGYTIFNSNGFFNFLLSPPFDM